MKQMPYFRVIPVSSQCSIYSNCGVVNFKSKEEECRSCCIDRIMSSCVLCEKTKQAWNFLLNTYNREVVDDNRLYIILCYTAIPSLLHRSYKDLMISFYVKNNISFSSMTKGKWLPEHINIKTSMIYDILETQGINFTEKIIHNDAINFFINENNQLFRNKAAHNFVESFEQAKSILIQDCMDKIFIILHFIACLDNYVSKFVRYEEKVKQEKIELFCIILNKILYSKMLMPIINKSCIFVEK